MYFVIDKIDLYNVLRTLFEFSELINNKILTINNIFLYECIYRVSLNKWEVLQ